MKRLVGFVVALCIGALLVPAFAQSKNVDVTLVMPNGAMEPFTITASNGCPQVYYQAAGAEHCGIMKLEVNGTTQDVPWNLIARADLVKPKTKTVWRFTLKDGRVFDGASPDATYSNGNLSSNMYIRGLNQFGATVWYLSYPSAPNRQPFIGIIFDKKAAAAGAPSAGNPSASAPATADAITLRNGDQLIGTVNTPSFVLQTSYATLTFKSSEIQLVTIEGSGNNNDKVVLRAGDRLSGVIKTETIDFTLQNGTHVTLDRGNVAKIQFHTK